MSDDKTPPDITTGSFVSWSNGKGRVDLVVTTGTVPGVEGDVEATSDSPAARVVIWEDGKPTKKKYAASTHTLRRIAPLDGDEKKDDPTAALVALQADHERLSVDMGDGHGIEVTVTGTAIKAAYDRGVLSWPGSGRTDLSPTQWGLGRAEHLCKAARGEVETTNDPDLLHKDHPVAQAAHVGRDEVVIDADEMQANLDAIMAEAGAE